MAEDTTIYELRNQVALMFLEKVLEEEGIGAVAWSRDDIRDDAEKLADISWEYTEAFMKRLLDPSQRIKKAVALLTDIHD